MERVNLKRAVLAGLAAGLFIDIAEGVLANFVVGGLFLRETQALHIPMTMTPAAGIFFVSWGPLVGLVTMFLYALARPTIGSPPKTALAVAASVWIVHGFIPHGRDAAIGTFSLELSARFAALQIVWQTVATFIGAWVYERGANDL